MPLSITVVPEFPDVPYALGVPAVLRSGTFLVPDIAVSVTVPLLDALLPRAQQQWGIYTQDGNPAFDYDSILTLGVVGSSKVPTYPIENGAFGNYNKVQMPYTARVLYAIGGSIQRKNAFISSIIAAKRSLTLYSVVMPEFFFLNANITDYDIPRRLDTVELLRVELHLTEIRPTATSVTMDAPQDNNNQNVSGPTNGGAITDPKEPSGASPQSNGTVQGVPAAVVPGLQGMSFPDSPT